jgi:hypothetical protein
LAVVVVAFVVTWMSIPAKRNRQHVGLPARVFAHDLAGRGDVILGRQGVVTLERRVEVIFGGAAVVIILVGLAFGAIGRRRGG